MSIASKQTEVKYLKTGRRGMLPYPAGEWAAEATYTATENVAPYVLRNGTYYVMNKVGSVKGLDPQTDYGTNGQQATWIPFEEYKAVYVELLMARLGLIGKSVFWDNYTFSQKGVDDKGQPSDQYQNFEAGTFTPNILIDWVEGTMRLLKLVAEGADVTGKLTANAGSTIGGMTSYTNFLRYMETLKETIGGSELGRQVVAAMGNSCLPSSSARHCNLYIKDETTGTFKSLVYIDSAPTVDNISASITDYRDFNRAIDIEQGTLRVGRGNLVDMPGVLLAGRVGGTGGTLWNFGKRRVSSGKYAFLSARTGSNNNYEYTITHNLGHLNYAVSVTPFITGTWRKVHAVVTAQSANSFTVRLIDSGTENDGEAYPFMFVVVGEN